MTDGGILGLECVGVVEKFWTGRPNLLSCSLSCASKQAYKNSRPLLKRVERGEVGSVCGSSASRPVRRTAARARDVRKRGRRVHQMRIGFTITKPRICAPT